MTGRRREAFRLILAVLGRGLGLPPPARGPGSVLEASGPAWREAVRLAAEHRVAPALGAAVARLALPVPGEAGDVLALLRERNGERNRMLRGALLRTVRDLNRIGVEPVLLKGGLRLLDDLYPDPSWRFLGDLDLLVPAGRAAEAHAHLAALGYTPPGGAAPAPEGHHHLIPLRHPGLRATIEIHRTAMLGPLDRLLPAGPLAEGAAPLEVDGARLLLPDAGRQLVHVVAHAQLQHELHLAAGLALRDLVEARLLLRRCGGPAGAMALRAAFAPHGRGRVAEAYLALLDRHLPDGAPSAAATGGGTGLQLLRVELALRSARAEAAGAALGHYRVRLERLAGSAAARSRLLRGLADPAYLARHRAEFGRLWRGVAGSGKGA